MISPITIFAATEASSETNLFSSIGIDWKLLLLQSIAFLILLWFLKKFVYPPLVAMLDKSEKAQAAANEAAREAQKLAEESQDATKQLLSDARTEAKSIVATAREEANTMVADAETRAKDQAQHLIDAAHDDIAKEVVAAKKALHNETIDLVVRATEKVVGAKVDAGVDQAAIKSALEEAK